MIEREGTPKMSKGLSRKNIPARIVAVLSGLIGCIVLTCFVGFIYTGLPSHIDLGLNHGSSLTLNSLLCLSFFLQHSLMIRGVFRSWLLRIVPRAFHGAIFSIVSGLFLLNLMLFWQKSETVLFRVDDASQWVMRIIFGALIIALIIAGKSLGKFDPFGIHGISSYISGQAEKASKFVVRGPYRWVRHPLYSLFLLMIWCPIVVTPDRLLFNSLWTIWIIIGTILEERDLVAAFADDYRKYQRNVPMLLPYKGFSLSAYQK